ncbi:hypothetical protein NT6N_28390 [Oceaniferula spumae]|uniref:Verru_Chthon cassette protein A n=1 Tax=Oceaniferula spumae TaxID=2979115 RepID=A0AAT9FPD6_9BACT
MKINKNHCITSSSPRGFALIATISIMVLLTMIALAMLSLSTVELRTARHSHAQAEAQANARLGLQIALGRLQTSLGPDARATANASILDTDPSSPEIDGVRHAHWLGAYPTINPNSPDDGIISPRTLRDWSLENMEWLVSTSDPNTAADPTAPLGGDVITMGQFIKDGTATIPDTSSIDGLSAALLTKAQAGLVKVEENSGRYGWWVGDESMKARIDTLASTNGSDVLAGTEVNATAQKSNNYQITQGVNLESQLPTYKDDPEKLFKLITHNELTMLGSESADSSWKNWSLLNQDKFTPYSYSLPVNVADGRLKQDLTAYFKGSYTGLDKQSMIDPRFPVTATRVPTFDFVKQWANMVEDRTTPQPVVAPNYDPTSPEHGLHPVFTQGAVAMQHSYQITGQRTFKPVTMIMPQIQLWNPHNVKLEARDYIVQVGYQFRWWMQTGIRNTDEASYDVNPVWHSWEEKNNHAPLPPHKPADNENIDYQGNKRFFTFVIKDQAFEAGESLIFHAKPPASGAISGVPYNMNEDADTDILKNYTNDGDLNLLVNEGNLDEFFYVVSPSNGTLDPNSNANLSNMLRTEPNFRSTTTGSGANDDEDLDMHLNLYTVNDGTPSLLHAMKKPQRNERYGNWQRPTYPLNRYQDGSLLASATYDGKSALVNFGSSMLVSNFDIFQGGNNMNLPPKAGQPHAVLGYWNIRNQESFSTSETWSSGSLEASKWLNSFSFRSTQVFKTTWESAENLYGNLSTDRLGGWHLSQVQDMVYPMFDYPTTPYGPLSLGSFQHANLSVYGWQPTYAFGNAQAPPRFDRTKFQSSEQSDLYDISYLLNASSWDRYYLSTIPQSGTALKKGMRLPNSRQFLTTPTGEGSVDEAKLINADGFELSASNVMIHGGFNVNSTSVTAWKAFLSGAMGQSVETLHSSEDSNVATAAAMGRFLAPLMEETEAVANDRNSTRFDRPNTWASTRTLNSDEINILAGRIVEEVKRRGPFLSLADFVNRRLEPDSDVTGDERTYQEVLGTLQAAINKATMEDQKINYHYYANESNNGIKMTIKPDEDWSSGGLDFTVSSSAQEAMLGYPVSKINQSGGLIHNYAPNFLSQADVLTKIGPSITVRGDTFVIRAYGDSIDSRTGEIAAKAWCEAVVQRVAKPVAWDGSSSQLMQPQAPSETGFGRRFNVVSFRWLNEKDVMPYSDDDAIAQ